ncbi:hypothetical protein [Rhodococcus sp. X156]|uniref:DoxX family protein n=1 Tax=Rhodococcus sp. X156 TaxID=2499145 RepID=UPI001F49F1B0|nr:hypothetical protein [Rhodococcus sp. X156]
MRAPRTRAARVLTNALPGAALVRATRLLRNPEHRRVALLAGGLGGSSVVHAVRPQVFEPIIPPGIGDARRWVYVSGVAEAACAALLLVPATRRLGGWVSAAVLVGVFPANVYSVKVVSRSKPLQAVALARLPLQVPMITAALRVAKG